MKNNLRLWSILALALAVPGLIITDWYFKEFGIFVMFIFLTVGIVLDQLWRMLYQNVNLDRYDNYRTNRLLIIIAIILFIQSPVALIYLNRIVSYLGIGVAIIMIALGIIFDQIARIKFPYNIIELNERGEK